MLMLDPAPYTRILIYRIYDDILKYTKARTDETMKDFGIPRPAFGFEHGDSNRALPQCNYGSNSRKGRV